MENLLSEQDSDPQDFISSNNLEESSQEKSGLENEVVLGIFLSLFDD